MERPRVRPMVPGDLAGMPVACAGREHLDGLLDDPHAAWARAAQDRWGLCGLLVVDDDQPVGAALVSPAPTLPAGHPLARCARAHDTAYLLALCCPATRDGAHLARLVAQGLCRHLGGRVAAVEAMGSTRGHTCVEPRLDWLLDAGFRPDPARGGAGRRVRLDVDGPVRWHPLDRAWELLAGLVPRPAPAAGPTGREIG